jgi:arginyl-tRNA synthetase
MSVFRKAAQLGINTNEISFTGEKAGKKEIDLIKLLRKFSETVSDAAAGYSPALIANYCYDLSREYNQFYHDFTILGETDEEIRNFRLALSKVTSEIIFKGMWLLGIEMPERM